MTSSASPAVVLGYGPVGQTVTRLLLDAGRDVRVVTRSGSGPAEAERVSADLLDPAATARAIGTSPAVFLCVHAPYVATEWARLLPPMEASVLSHAKATGAVVATVESLYAFDAGHGPMSAATPLRPVSRKGAVRKDLIEARTASGARVVSVVAGDFYGPRVLMSHAGERLVAPLLAGRTLRPVGDIDLPHAFTHVPDLAAAMVRATEVQGAGHEVVFAPHAGSLTMRQLVALTATAAGVPVPRLAPLSPRLLTALGTVVPSLREIAEMAYQFTQPFEIDARDGEARLGLTATPWDVAARETVAWWRAREGAAAAA